MARHMGDDPQTFRAVLEYERPKRNPEYRWPDHTDVPEYLDEWELRREFRGPYGTAGAARGQFGRQRREGLWGGSRFVRQYVERAATVWEEVE
ncbi:hypothetical protein ACWGHD_19115 [Streptomyces xanthophaeus]